MYLGDDFQIEDKENKKDIWNVNPVSPDEMSRPASDDAKRRNRPDFRRGPR